jgi:lycopene beta-cyclase
MTGLRVTVFDASGTPPTDRTWCSWSVREHRFADAVSQRWSRVRVRGGGRDTIVDTEPYPYVCIRGADFFRHADEQLASRAEVRRGVRVVNIAERSDAVTLALRHADGSEEEASFDMLFDARTYTRERPNREREPLLIQHFGGFEIDATGARLDPETVTLMDFEVPQSQGAHFMYVLPFSSGTALVESTFMTPRGYPRVDYESYALQYVERELGLSSPTIRYRESGALPMTLASLGPPATARTWPIGTRAGVGRASSGYAFDAIQADTRRVVDALLTGAARPRPPRSPVLSMLDRVLLSWLERDPTAAPLVFGRLFAVASTPRLIRFLADQPSATDLLATMWAMPKWRTITHTLTHPSAWPRPSAPAPSPAAAG